MRWASPILPGVKIESNCWPWHRWWKSMGTFGGIFDGDTMGRSSDFFVGFLSPTTMEFGCVPIFFPPKNPKRTCFFGTTFWGTKNIRINHDKSMCSQSYPMIAEWQPRNSIASHPPANPHRYPKPVVSLGNEMDIIYNLRIINLSSFIMLICWRVPSRSHDIQISSIQNPLSIHAIWLVVNEIPSS